MLVRLYLLLLFVSLIGRSDAQPVMGEGHLTLTINDGWTFEGQRIKLPHTWNTDAYTVKDYRQGCFTYERSFVWHPAGRQTWLKFDAAFKRADVLVNGQAIGQHVGGYTAFAFNLTPYLREGSNTLQVKVSNADETIAPVSADFTFMGGIYRDVWLIEKTPQHGVNVTANLHQVTVDCKVSAPDGCQVVSVLQDAEGHVIAQAHCRAGATTRQVLPLPKQPHLWSPESPYLYKVVTLLQSKNGKTEYDRQQRSVGVRSYAFDAENGFLLNGKPYKLHGVCIHQDQKPYGIALDDDQHRRDFRLMKEMGVNFVRLAHYPQDDALLELCDREGMLVWEEIPVVDVVPEGDKTYFGDVVDKTSQLVKEHPGLPLLFSIMLGTNDTVERTKNSHTTPEAYAHNLCSIIDSLLVLFPEAHVVLNKPTWYYPDYVTKGGSIASEQNIKLISDYFKEFDNVVAHCKKGHVHIGDSSAYEYIKEHYRTDVFEETDSRGKSFWLHPNERGAKKLAEYWGKALLPLIKSL